MKEDIQRLNKEAKTLLLSNPKRALELAIKAEQLSQQINDEKSLAESFFSIASAKWRLGMLEEAEEWTKKAIHLFEQLGDVGGLAQATQGLGMIYRKKGLYIEALQNYQHALQIARKINDEILIANCLNNLASLHAHLQITQKQWSAFLKV
jgi:tetratricopeptide (TPR) repeat protein